ncbi:hypothetical protein L1987_41172 [Smallanthus sonchifolius]|uniref:Uncharacterized protein n=1 Tax=Smallanthus sonchifolius TaxID=185202 RepID=A0ACB9GVG1_9ASTR|nr:hypothetical protein L1987_41172 [Smallanthus sonchifolius]
MDQPKKDELRYHHFSHDHSLDYTKLQPHNDAICSGCRHPITPGKFYYRCKLCGFYLHQIDFQNSLIGNNGGMMQAVVREDGIPEEKRMYGGVDDSEGFEESRRLEKSRGSSYQRSASVSSGVIGAHIWTELEQATEKRNSKAGDRRVELDTVSDQSC